MSVVEPGSDRAKMIGRIKSLLMQPTPTWDEIAAEPADVKSLYVGWIVPLYGLAAVSIFLSAILWGQGVFGFTYRPGIVESLTSTLVQFVLGLVMLAVLAWVIKFLAPKFEGVGDQDQAFKLAAYSGTAVWVGGMFAIVPVLGGVAGLVGAIYSLVLLYKGLPRLMKSAEDKTAVYFASLIGVMIVAGLIFAALMGALNMGSPFRVAHVEEKGSITIPGSATIDLNKVEQQAKQAQAAMEKMQSGEGGATSDPETLKAFLPGAVMGLARESVSTGFSEVGGLEAASAKGVYKKGDARLELQVADIGAAGALAGLMGAFNIRSSEETGSAYEKVGRVDGRMTQEKYDRSTKSGEYSVLVGDQFMVQASGQGVSPEDLKAAVKSVNLAALEKAAEAR